MEREAFVNLDDPWWLLRRDIPSRLEELRDELGRNVEWDRDWYERPQQVEEFYMFLLNQQPMLLNQLDEATDETRMEQWLQELVTITRPAQAEPAHEPAHEAGSESQATQAEAPADEPPFTWNDEWGMFLRLKDGSYEFSLSTAPGDGPGINPPAGQPDGTWYPNGELALEARQRLSQPETPATGTAQTASSAGAAAADAPASTSAESESAASESTEAEPEVTWNDQWGMFLRHKDGNYEYSLSNVLADAPGVNPPAGQPDGTWHKSAEEASAARQQVSQLKESFAEFVANPEVPISQEELDAALQDPNFKENLAAAEAALEAELEAELAALETEEA